MLDGFSIKNFRSFGEERQTLMTKEKINLIIGKNNVGKSNALRTITHLLPKLVQNENPEWNDHLDASTFSAGVAEIGLFVPTSKFAFWKESAGAEARRNIAGMLAQALQTTGIAGLWFHKQRKGNWEPAEVPPGILDILKQATSDFGGISRYMLGLTGNSSSELADVARLLSFVSPFTGHLATALIPAIRSTNFPNNTPGRQLMGDVVFNNGIQDFGGAGLIERLFKLQSPDITETQSEQRYNALTNFLRSTFNNSSARVSVPHNKSGIYLAMDGKTRPISSYGTGIEQVVIIAAAATVLEKHIVCLEEPETNLHPEFQIRLLRYLQEETNNQYFITTHSSSLINLSPATIHRARLDEKGTKMDALLRSQTQHDLVFDLGYRPSDLAQTNCVIWVEGPSDRIYLNSAIQALAPDLVEGTDYSVLFYGGRLLSHLSVDDDQIADLINLAQISRRSGILIDSDRATPSDGLNKTKERALKEFTDKNLFSWLTDGREMENYINPELLRTILAEMYPSSEMIEGDRYSDVCTLRKKDGTTFGIDKVKLAHRVAIENINNRFGLDWDENIEKLISFIRSSH